MFQELTDIAAKKTTLAAGAFEAWSPGSLEPQKGTDPFAGLRAELEAKQASLSAKEKEIMEREANLTEASAEIDRMSASLKQIIDGYEKAKKGFWEQNGRDVVSFAYKLAEKIVLKTLNEDPSILARQIQTVVDDMKINEAMDIQLSAADLGRLQASKSSEVAEILKDTRIRWHGDPRLEAGRVFIDTSRFRLDASIMTALANLEADVTVTGGEG